VSEKITPEHLERAAYVYVRQSTTHQVRFNLEGQKRQYGLGERARALGFAQVVVIDEDLGRSGSGLQERPGFGRLLAAVCRRYLSAFMKRCNLRYWSTLVSKKGLSTSHFETLPRPLQFTIGESTAHFRAVRLYLRPGSQTG
jgi:hypothetical protein